MSETEKRIFCGTGIEEGKLCIAEEREKIGSREKKKKL
jgi:hypothetical protein